MQITDMKLLRSFCIRRQFSIFKAPRQLSFIVLQNPSFPRQTPQFSRFFQATSYHLRCQETSWGGVRSVYDPLSGETETWRGVSESGLQEPDSFSSSFDSGFYDVDKERTYGAAKKENPSKEVKQHRHVSSSSNVAKNLSKEKQPDSGFYDIDRERTYGAAKKEAPSKEEKQHPHVASLSNGDDNLSKEKDNIVYKQNYSGNGPGHGSILGDIVRSSGKKKGKEKTVWVCSDCGHSDGQWWGSCRSCNQVGTMNKFCHSSESSASGSQVSKSWIRQQSDKPIPQKLNEVNRGINQLNWRISLSGLFGDEVDRVLGGGLAPGSLVLVCGDPGIGKSTLMLQMAAIISEGSADGGPAPVVYVSGEESVEQIGNRADRMRIKTEELYLYSSTDVEDILAKAHLISPRALVIDSIQTVYLKGVTGSAGGISQVKECTTALLNFAKKTNIPVLLVGHVTKTGDIAGPRVLEHIVDVVLYMEGEELSSFRLLRSVKNRFGSTDELGVFEMAQSGLQAVSNPSGIFLSEQYSDSEVLAGLAIAVIMDGSRSFLIEIQALCVSGSTVQRHVNGIQASRADMIISVLMKQAGLKLQENAVFLNVVSGVSLTETAGDLAIAAAICSSFLELPIPYGIAFIGEIGLAGELRTVPRMEKRVGTVAKLGYKKCIIPKSAEKSLAILGTEEMQIIGCKNLKEVINVVFASC